MIEITPKMIESGVDVYLGFYSEDLLSSPHEVVRDVLISALGAASSVRLVGEGPSEPDKMQDGRTAREDKSDRPTPAK